MDDQHGDDQRGDVRQREDEREDGCDVVLPFGVVTVVVVLAVEESAWIVAVRVAVEAAPVVKVFATVAQQWQQCY